MANRYDATRATQDPCEATVPPNVYHPERSAASGA